MEDCGTGTGFLHWGLLQHLIKTKLFSHSLSKGADAGIGVGVSIGVLLLAAGAFLLGRRQRGLSRTTPYTIDPVPGSQYKAELDNERILVEARHESLTPEERYELPAPHGLREAH